MVALNKKLAEGGMLLRVLGWGESQTRKTWWAGKAAEAGFNVIMLDGDGNWQILKNIQPAAQPRLNIIDVQNTLKKAVFAEFLTYFLVEGKVTYSESLKQFYKFTNANMPADTMQLDWGKLDKNCVLIIDSWTAFARSIMYRFSIENHIDLTDPEKVEWDGYRWSAAIANHIMEGLKMLPCHIIVTGHEVLYEKSKQVKRGKKTEKIVEYQRRQIISTSGPHAMEMAKNFSDNLHFVASGPLATTINAQKEENSEGGSRTIAPGIYQWDKLQFKDLCLAAGIALPPPDLPYINLNYKESLANATPQMAPVATQNVQTSMAAVAQQAIVKPQLPTNQKSTLVIGQ